MAMPSLKRCSPCRRRASGTMLDWRRVRAVEARAPMAVEELLAALNHPVDYMGKSRVDLLFFGHAEHGRSSRLCCCA